MKGTYKEPEMEIAYFDAEMEIVTQSSADEPGDDLEVHAVTGVDE
jgi:hypothetical protein